MSLSFAITWDYRCPFARNAHDHVLTALEGGAPWDVTWVPFWLTQAHVGEGEPDAWDDPAKASTLLSLEAAIVVRDRDPEHWFGVHRALFSARHDQGLDLRQAEVIRAAVAEGGADPAAVWQELEAGWPAATVRKEHTQAVEEHNVWGVPTFIANGQAAFVRLMNTPGGDLALARRSVERIVDTLTGWPDLNEFKHTSLPR